jgi:two-component system, OmpR family, sensor histidine kinase CiaH
MSLFSKKRLAIATTVYWVLLAYIISGLAWWFIALQRQNRQMVSYKLMGLKLDDIHYEFRLNAILMEAQRKTAGYIGEGATFLILILVGALFVYREFRRQIRLQMQQQNFMMAVTHELKTPIAVAKLNLETLQKHRLDEGKQQKIIQTALQELGRLDTLTNNVLISSQLEGGDYIRVKEDLDLSALVMQVINDCKHRFPEREWQTDVLPDLHIQGDQLLIQLLISNLTENAIKYSPRDSPVTVILRKEGRRIVLSVKDTGTGITDEEKKKIFQKFYRTGNEKTRSTQGTGLGLYLCRKIADDHKASIKVSNNSPVGSIFTVEF